MSDENTSTETGTDQPVTQTGDAPEWARNAITKANNEAAKYRTDLRAKTEEHTAVLAQVDTLSAEKAEALERASNAEKELLKYKTTVAANVPGEQAGQFAGLLQGNTAEELKAHADQLLAMFGPPNKRVPATDPSQGQGNGEPTLSEGAAFLANALQGKLTQ